MSKMSAKIWDKEKVENALTKIKRKRKIKKSDYLKEGKFPVIDQGGKFIAGFSDKEDCVYTDIPITIFGDHTRNLKYVKEPFITGADGTQCLIPTTEFDRRFFYFALKNTKLKNYGYERHFKYLKEQFIAKPPKNIQELVGAILGNFDDLIENNTKRITILQDIAKIMFREWFINFSIPGENINEFEDTDIGKVPKGWKIKKINDVTDVIDCLHSKKPQEVSDTENILLHVWNINEDSTLDLSKKFCISNQDYNLWSKNIEVIEGDCVITNVGRIAAIAQIPKGVKAAIGRNMTALRPRKEEITPGFLMQFLLSDYMRKEVATKKDAGAIMDSMNVKGIRVVSIIIPPKPIMKNFENIIWNIRKQIENLVKKNQYLSLIRDSLMPKLINERVNVLYSHIEVEA